ncbi:MAG: GAF domain-containing protein [Actinomycetota bacterium]
MVRSRTHVERSKDPKSQPDLHLSSLAAASKAVNTAMHLDDALRLILNQAKQLVEADEGSIMLLDDNQLLHIRISEGIPPDEAQKVQIALGEGVAGKVALAGEPMLITDLPGQRRFESFVPMERELHSAICVPLSFSGGTVGVLNLNITHPGRLFTQSELRVTQLFAEQAAMVIHKAQLLEASQAAELELTTLLDVTRELVEILDLERLLNRVLEGGLRLLGADKGFICIYDDSTHRVTLGVYRGLIKDDMRLVFNHPGFHRLLSGQTPEHRPLSEFQLDGLGANGSAYVCPMRGEDATRVLMILLDDGHRPDQIRLCHAFTSHAVLAIRNAQLYNRLHTKESELSSIIYSMSHPVIVVDQNGSLAEANPSAQELFHFSLRFLKGQPIIGLLGVPVLEALLGGENDDVIEVSVGDPVARIWKAKVSEIHIIGGRGGRILIMDDITAEREAQKLKADFVAVVGHELRTPLTVVKGYIKTLIRRGDDLSAEQTKEAHRTIDAQTQRLERLVEDLLYVSRIETSRPTLHLQSTDIVELAHGLLSEFKMANPDREFTLMGPSTLSLMLDRTKIEQALYHLLDNACKYSVETSPVKVELTEEPSHVIVGVVDKGVGMLSGDIPLIFDLFHQVDSTSTRRAGGTGVGLYICKSMADAHKAQITVDSVWGKGTTFRIRIPKDVNQSA